MKVIGDHDNIVRIVCSRCNQWPLGATAVVGVKGGEVRVLHLECSKSETQFMSSEGGARSLTLPELAQEISASLSA